MKLYKLAPLSLGTFAIGTDLFMIAGILQMIGAGLNVSLAAAGALVTVFAVVNAISAPILATATANRDRRRLAMECMGLFALMNVICAFSPNYVLLLLARIVAAAAAATYSPAATTIAVSNVAPENRGKAIAIVTGGLTVALVLGVPIGTAVGHLLGWRATFLFVALLSAIAVIGIGLTFPRVAAMQRTTLRQRLAPLGQATLNICFLQTAVVIAGTFVVYTYIGSFIEQFLTSATVLVSALLLLYGLGSIIGNYAGGRACDRWGANRVAVITVSGMAVCLALVSVVGTLQISNTAAIVLCGITLFTWASVGWGFVPAQFTRIAHLAKGPEQMQLAFALNGSALQLGIAIGALVGQVLVGNGLLIGIGWAGSIFELLALVLLAFGLRASARARVVAVASAQ